MLRISRVALGLVLLWGLSLSGTATGADQPVKLIFTRAELEAKWHSRIRSFLDRGVIPLIDMESSIARWQSEKQLVDRKVLQSMDELGIALVAFDADQAPRAANDPPGYRWGYHMHEAVNAHPDRFVLTANAGTSPNWRQQGKSQIEQTETQVRTGDYALLGEYEFRHYMSQSECKEKQLDRDEDIHLDSPNGHRLFALAAETGVPVLIHNEPEDAALDRLEDMLRQYPKAKVIWAHFGQIRRPERERRFNPGYVRQLLTSYPNLYFDLSVGAPGRTYDCQGHQVVDTVIWKQGTFGQINELDPPYKAILEQFSDRFVSGMDYGPENAPLGVFWPGRVGNLRLIMRDLSDEAKHRIAYKNAWKLLTGHEFTMQ